MPFVWVLVRVMVYLMSMVVGAGITTAYTKYMQKRKLAQKKRRTEVFHGFESEAHEHGK